MKPQYFLWPNLKSHIPIISAISYQLHRSGLFNMEANYKKAWITKGKNHWEPSENLIATWSNIKSCTFTIVQPTCSSGPCPYHFSSLPASFPLNLWRPPHVGTESYSILHSVTLRMTTIFKFFCSLCYTK